MFLNNSFLNPSGFEDLDTGFCPNSDNGSSTSSETMGQDQQKQALDWFAYAILNPIIVGIGVLGNVLNLIVLTRPSLKGVTYTYLIGLACSDLGVLLCAIPMMIRQLRGNAIGWSWYSSIFYGHLELPLSNLFMASSIFIVVCLTVDRFASVCLPTRFKSFHTTTNARTAIVLCYIIAFLVSVPLGLLKKVCRVGPTSSSQSSSQIPSLYYKFSENESVTQTVGWHIYAWLEATLVRFGPGGVLAVLNVLIIRRFLEITKKRRAMLTGSAACGGAGASGSGGGASDIVQCDQYLLRGEKISKRIYKEEKRLVILLTVIVLLFFITTTPVAFLNIFYTQKLDSNIPFQIFRVLANSLEICNYALNFYVYFLCSKEFRSKFLSFFTILLPKKAKTNFQSITLPELSQNKVNHSRGPQDEV